MMNFRVGLTTAAVAAFTLVCGAASAETWRMAHKMPAESIEGQILQAVADRIAEKTEGKITVQVFPAEQLGKDDAILGQLQPYRVMVTKKPVESLDDVAGLKLRKHPDELAAAAWRHLGAEVRTLAWTETYESIGRGIVEAVNSPVALVESMRFYEVAPHIVRHDEYPQGLAFMANATAWNGLDETTRAQIIEAYDEVAAEFAAKTDATATESLERMAAKGVTYSVIDTAPFVARMAEFYAAMDAEGTLPAGLMDAINATRLSN
jgi:TRAP-type C4-dicarboxylate transport system substrate-binding protein